MIHKRDTKNNKQQIVWHEHILPSCFSLLSELIEKITVTSKPVNILSLAIGSHLDKGEDDIVKQVESNYPDVKHAVIVNKTAYRVGFGNIVEWDIDLYQ